MSERTVIIITVILCITALIAVWLHGRANRFVTDQITRKAGSYSLEYLYRTDRVTGKTVVISRETEKEVRPE